MPTVYYACLQLSPRASGKKRNRIIKVKCYGRENARAYIRKHYNSKIHSSCWTE